MQVRFTFDCRECGKATTLTVDSSAMPAKLRLTCRRPRCAHTSGELDVDYHFRLLDHAPRHERERYLAELAERKKANGKG